MKAQTGSVSTDTMRPEDRIPALLDELEDLDLKCAQEIVAGYIASGWPGDYNRYQATLLLGLIIDDPLPDELAELAGHLLEDLAAAIQHANERTHGLVEEIQYLFREFEL